ncbi:MAG TPA: hypothetical protein VMV79_08580, partial [Alphaproteobacteria bacterium]|nr:hypothetical protein [Alphaproteobacteria bacterium]
MINPAEKANMPSKAPANTTARYKRVLVKLSGEALMGEREYGLDPDTVERVAEEIKTVTAMGVEVCA